MTPGTWARLSALFEEAAELAPEARARFVAVLRASEPAIGEELEAMLGVEEAGELELERRLAREAAPEPIGEEGMAADTRIGAYRLERLLGRGGMGEVYLAQRADGAFTQRVALKVVRAGLFGEDAMRRFERERRILARLEHPAVVPLLDGGVTPDGRPYLVMQLVEGLPLTAYAQAHALPEAARLRLFLAVCRAVEFSHSRLIVHRDLKPSNILVTPEGDVRLLDFGIAKLLRSDGESAEPDLTRHEMAPMTPERAAPEQQRGEPVSTATDVWGLGLLLHELLTGRLPGAPVPPSPPLPSLRGDLGAIVERALDPEPTRRYAAAGLLAQDVEAYADGRPVSARRDRLGYRARRFVGRHRAATAAAAVAVLALVTIAFNATVQAARTARERDRATVQEERANAVVDLVIELFGETAPTAGAGVATVSIADLLARGEKRVDDLVGQPETQARMWQTLGRIRLERSEVAPARALLDRARAASRHLAADDPRRVEIVLDHAESLVRADDRAGARRELEELVQELELSAPSESALLGRALEELGLVVRRAEGLALIERSLALRRALDPPRPAEVASALSALGVLERERGDRAAAREHWRESVRLYEQTLGPEHPETTAALNNLALLLDNDLAGKIAAHRRLLATHERTVGVMSNAAANDLNNLGVTLIMVRDFEGGAAALREAHRRCEALVGPDHQQTINILRSIGRALELQDRLADALAVFEDVERRLGRSTHEEYQRVRFHHQWAQVLVRLGRGREALPVMDHTVAVLRAAYPEGSGDTGDALLVRGRIHAALGDFASAERDARDAMAERERYFPPTEPRRAEARVALGIVLCRAGQLEEGRRLIGEALAAFAAWPLAHRRDVAEAQDALAGS